MSPSNLTPYSIANSVFGAFQPTYHLSGDTNLHRHPVVIGKFVHRGYGTTTTGGCMNYYLMQSKSDIKETFPVMGGGDQ